MRRGVGEFVSGWYWEFRCCCDGDADVALGGRAEKMRMRMAMVRDGGRVIVRALR